MIVLLVLCLLMIGIYILVLKYKSDKSPYKGGSKNDISKGVLYPFKIYNYLPTHNVKIDIADPKGLPKEIISKIEPMGMGSLSPKDVITYLKPGNTLKFYIYKPNDHKNMYHYSDYVIDTSEDERIKALHIGMITTRFLGSTDVLRQSSVQGNAVGGEPWVIIHNLTYIPLSFNVDPAISVKPHDVYRYQGYMHMGVPLGTILKDNTGIYPPFEYLQPHTDIFYGVISDIQQSLEGCWQLEYTDNCSYGQTMWPFQDGVY